MKLKEIVATTDQRVNLGNFEGIAPTARLSADLEKGDDPEKCFAEIYALTTRAWAKEALKKIRLFRSFAKDKKIFDEENGLKVAEIKKLLV